MSLVVRALQLGWLGSQLPAWRRFQKATQDCEGVQQARLATLLPLLADSAYGREVGVGVRPFRDLPIVDYDTLRPWVERVAAGEPGVLTCEPVEMLERTGGSSGGDKLVPYTARLRSEFSEAVGAWMVDLHRGHPHLLGTRSYWSVSRAVRSAEITAGGLRVGFQDDAEYFGPVTRWAVGRLMAVDSSVAKAPNMEAWRWATWRALVACPDLGLISVWSPSYLTRLFEWAGPHRDALGVAHAWDGQRLRADRIWPRLRLVSCWGDGFAERLLPELALFLGDVPVQKKGVLATEGVISFPLVGHEGHALAVTSHVLELRDVDDGSVRQAHEARVGGQYQPLLTTGGGFVRYGLPDRLEVIGHVGQVPLVRLLGRLDKGSDLVGEKLTEGFVARALAEVFEQPPGFAMLVPRSDRYVLVVDRDPPAEDAVDAALAQEYHYRYARDLGQLRCCEVAVRPDAWARWERGIEACGLSLGDQKPGALEVRELVGAALLDLGEG